MAIVFDIRSFQSARKQVKQFGLGPNVYLAVVRQIKAEQKLGNSGANVAGHIANLRRRAAVPTPTSDPEVA